MALRSAAIWQEVGAAAGIRVEPCGSLHLAHNEDERQVLDEFVDAAPEGYSIIPPEMIEKKWTSAVNRNRFLGALWSPLELAVDPREAIPGIARHLSAKTGVDFQFSRCVVGVEDGAVHLADGATHEAGRTLIASDHEMHLLFPEELAAANMMTYKLHMMKTITLPKSLK